MLRSTRFATIALAFVFPFTLISAQQPVTESSKQPDFFVKKHYVQLAHKPELVAMGHQLSDDEKRDAIQTAVSRITRKKTANKISVDSTLVLTADSAVKGDDFYLLAQDADFDPSRNYLACFPYNSATGSSVSFIITVKPNTMYTLVLDVYSPPVTFTVQSVQTTQQPDLSTLTTTVNSTTDSELLYTFDAASAGQIGIRASATGNFSYWVFDKAELIATPLD